MNINAECAWIDFSKKDTFNHVSYRKGIRRFKAALIRDVEKRIKELEEISRIYPVTQTHMSELKNFITIIKECKP